MKRDEIRAWVWMAAIAFAAVSSKAAALSQTSIFHDPFESGSRCAWSGGSEFLALGQSCSAGASCCSGVCESNVCQMPPAAPKSPGAPCTVNSECASSRCDTYVDGVRRCSHPNQCEPAGGSCSRAADCCSLQCSQGTCSTLTHCVPADSICSVPEDCCSNSCIGGFCGGSPTCGTLGEECVDNGGCCSGECIGGRCSFGNYCRAEGDQCALDTDCCSGSCDSGVCEISAGCVAVDEPSVSGAGSCCGHLSVSSGFPAGSNCGPLGGCLSPGEVCGQDAECCTHLCVSGGGGALAHCAPGAGCRPDGSLCDVIVGPFDCCGGNAQNTESCQPTVTGVSRCFPNGGLDACYVNGTACSMPDQCCSGFCLRNDSSVTGFSCAAGCLGGGQSTCTSSVDCCRGTVCRRGTCVGNGPFCSPVGGTCASAADCCLGSCNAGRCN